MGSLKASFVFLADLSRAMPILNGLDFVELAGYGSAQMGGHEQIRVLKDLDADIRDRDVIVVEDVIDTGLTLHYLVRTFELRKPRSISAVTLLDRPYRRLVDDLPVSYVGFVVPDELFVGYGFDLEERWRQRRVLPHGTRRHRRTLWRAGKCERRSQPRPAPCRRAN